MALERVIGQVAKHEMNARKRLLEDDPEMVFDRVGRAYGTLRHAYVIASKEALNLLSLLRLGAEMDFFPAQVVGLCDTLLMEIQPAHLQLHASRKLSPEQRDTIRAEIIRSRLQTVEAPAMNNDVSEEQGGNAPDDTIDL